MFIFSLILASIWNLQQSARFQMDAFTENLKAVAVCFL